MRHRSITALLAASAAVAFAAAPPAAKPIPGLPLVFESAASPDRGFVARGDGFSVRVAGGDAEFALRDGARVRMSIAGAQKVNGAGVQPLRGRTNYLFGPDRSRWLTGVPTFGRALYAGVLPGIDVEYYGKGRTLEFDFTVAPLADPSRIRLQYEGARRIGLDGGDLVIETAGGQLRQHRPYAYQDTASGRRQIAADWVRAGRTGAAFRLGPYDRTLPLVIDPAVNFSSYLGGSSADAVTAMTSDAEGWVYLVGTTKSPDFPGSAITPATGAQHVFLAKIHPALTGVGSMAFCTWFGGNGSDAPTAIAVDGKGVIYITGQTTSTDFPVTANSAQTLAGGGSDIFLIKLGVFGDSLVYSTLLGGSGNETGGGLAVNGDGIAYLSGGTASKNFPVTAGAIQKSLKGATDAVVARLDTTVVREPSLTWSSFFGGSSDDAAAALAMESGDIVWIGGTTQSSDFPKAGRYVLEYPGVGCGFVSRLDLSGQSGPVLYSSFLGGISGKTEVRAIAVDSAGFVGAVGVTESNVYPTSSLALRRNYGGAGDAFLTLVNPFSPTDVITYSTFLGGAGRDVANAVTIDPFGIWWVAGATASSAFPASTDAFGTFGGNKAFLTGINPRKVGVAGLLYSTAIGGAKDTSAQAVYADRLGNPYVAGRTASTDFPLGSRRYQDVTMGGDEGFLTVFEFQPLPKPQSLIVPSQPTLGGGGTVTGGIRPSIVPSGVTNAASAVGGAIAPGEIVRISGVNLGPDVPVGPVLDENGNIATVIGQVSVEFDGTPAPLLSVSSSQILAIVPYVVGGRFSSSIIVNNNSQASEPVVLPVAASMPGVFPTTVTNGDGTANSQENPATAGSLISFLATGEGQTDPAGVDGQIANGTLPRPVLPVSVTIDGIDATVMSAAGVQGSPAGYLRVVVQVPAGTSAQAGIVLTVGGTASTSNTSVSVQ